MDISELPDALYRLAQHLEQADDDPFTLRSRDAVLLAMKLLAERMTPEEAIRAMGGTPADLAPAHRLRIVDVYSPAVRAWQPVATDRPAPVCGERIGNSDMLAASASSYQAMIDDNLRLQEIDDAVNQALRLRYSPDSPAGEFDLPLPVRLRRELVRGLHGCGVAHAARLLHADDSAGLQASSPEPQRPDLLLRRLAAFLLPAGASDEEEMDSPDVNLELFGLGKEDHETRILLDHMNLGSGDASWPLFNRSYVSRGLSSYLRTIAKAQRWAVLLDLQPQYSRADPSKRGLPPTIRPLIYPVPPENRGAFSRLLDASVADMARKLEAEHDRRLGDLKIGQRLAVSVDFLLPGGRTVAHDDFAVSGPMFMVLNPGQEPPLGQTWTIYGPMTETLREAIDQLRQAAPPETFRTRRAYSKPPEGPLPDIESVPPISVERDRMGEADAEATAWRSEAPPSVTMVDADHFERLGFQRGGLPRVSYSPGSPIVKIHPLDAALARYPEDTRTEAEAEEDAVRWQSHEDADRTDDPADE